MYGPSEIIVFLAWSLDDLKYVGQTKGLEFLNLKREELVPIGIDLAKPYFLNHIEELAQYEENTNQNILYSVILIYVQAKQYNKVENLVTHKNKDVGDFAFMILQKEQGYTYLENFFVIGKNSLKWGWLIVGNNSIFLEFRKLGGKTGGRVQEIVRIKSEEISDLHLIKNGKTSIGLVIKTVKEENNLLFFYSGELMNVESLLSNRSIEETDADKLMRQLISGENVIRNKSVFITTEEHILFTLRQALVKHTFDCDYAIRKEEKEKIIARFDQEFQASQIGLQ